MKQLIFLLIFLLAAIGIPVLLVYIFATPLKNKNSLPKYKVYYEYDVFHTIQNSKDLKSIKIDTIPVDTIYVKIK